MTTKTKNRKARLQQIGTATVLWLTSGKLTTAYRLTTLDHGFGEAAYRLQKADQGAGPGEVYNVFRDGPLDVYDVLLDGARSSCECLGFIKHAHCKHVEGLEALHANGKI